MKNDKLYTKIELFTSSLLLYFIIYYISIYKTILGSDDKYVLPLYVISFSCLLVALFFKHKFTLLIYYISQLLLHSQILYIIHEPYQISNLLLLFTIIFYAKQTNLDKKTLLHTLNPFILLKISLGAYYFITFVKKILDPSWILGTALGDVFSFAPYFKSYVNIDLISIFSPIFPLMTYVVLFFQASFIFGTFTRYKNFWLIAGVLFHLGIYILLDAGLFSLLMIIWYIAFLTNSEIEVLKKLFNKLNGFLFS